MRSTWTAAVAIATADITSIAITASSVITATGGDFIAEGLRVGDVFRLTGSDTPANDNLNLTVKTLTTTVCTVVGTPLTDDAGPDTGYTLTILKKVKNGATPSKRTFYVEEYYQDLDETLAFGGCKFATCSLRGTPDGMATVEVGVVGASMNPLASGASPYYTTPALGTNPGMVFVDAQVYLDGVALVTATAFDMSITVNAATLPVIGATVTPDVFDNTMEITGSLSILRDDLTKVTAFDAETEFELQVVLEEPTGTPKKVVSFYLPKIKFTAADAPLGEDGAMVEVLPFAAGVQAAASGLDATMISIQTET